MGSACREREGQVQAPEGMGGGVAPSRRVGSRAEGVRGPWGSREGRVWRWVTLLQSLN